VRPAWAEINLAAIAHNVRVLSAAVAPARLCAVVKADGYGHGAVPVARAAVAAGARWLAVALADEGAALRDAGIDAPVLILSEPSASELDVAVANGLRPTLYTEVGVKAAAKAAAGRSGAPLPVHLKIDTGMHRVGARPEDAVALAGAIARCRELRLEAVWTHFATADEPDRPVTREQLRRFAGVLDDLGGAGLRPPMVHSANSAAGLGFPESRFDLVRAGIAVYGIPPSRAVTGQLDLRPAMQVKALVSFVKRVAAGEGVSYGHRWRAPADTVLATVPIGYADGVRRRLGLVGGEVLIGGRRRPIAGVVTMDQLTVDCGDDDSVRPGDEVVLLGTQGDDTISADEWAGRLDTISYEIVCAIGPRVPRRYR
jgi:alanine racemase